MNTLYMIVAKVKCVCGNWVRIRTTERTASKRCWNCAKEVSIKQRGNGDVEATCDGRPASHQIEYAEQLNRIVKKRR